MWSKLNTQADLNLRIDRIAELTFSDNAGHLLTVCCFALPSLFYACYALFYTCYALLCCFSMLALLCFVSCLLCFVSCLLWFALLCLNYENTPIQIYRKWHLKKKTENFQIKTLICFIFLLKTKIVVLEYPQSMFLSKYKKNNICPCKPKIYCIKRCLRG